MNLDQARFNMIEQQIRPCNIYNNEIINLFHQVKREKFVPKNYYNIAFSDLEIPLPGGQKMLAPRVEAILLQALGVTKESKILEIGSGSGYITACLAKMGDFVYAVEINEDNKQLAAQNLIYAGINNVSLIKGNGIHGLASKAPFDRIFIGGALINISQEIKSQLKIGGKLVGIIGQLPILQAVLIERVKENEYLQTVLFETEVDYLINENVAKFKF
jgi:protein-L-isoaspartate(D-aspartate) O-methyltransferase